MMVMLSTGNSKVGKGVLSTRTERASCPSTCPYLGSGCYAETGRLGPVWRGMKGALPWHRFVHRIASLPRHVAWRHNDAGDLPHRAGRIDRQSLYPLLDASKGTLGWTYTHHRVLGSDATAIRNRNTIRRCNRTMGLCVSLSAHGLAQADTYADLGIGPVVATVRRGTPSKGRTPAGRRYIVCPHQTGKVATCAECLICADPSRQVVVAFLAHGQGARKVEASL